MVITELPFTLCGHSAFGLQHLFCLRLATLKTLRSIESLKRGSGVTASLIKLANRVVSLGWHASGGHSGVYIERAIRCWSMSRIEPSRHTVFWKVAAHHHHRHRFSAGTVEELSTFNQVINCAVYLVELRRKCGRFVSLRDRAGSWERKTVSFMVANWKHDCLPERDGGTGCSHEAWRAGACQPCGS